MADCMDNLGFKSCLADQDIWLLRAATRPDDGFEYMEYVLLYVDDVLVVSHDGMSILDKVDRFFPMNEGSKGSPDMYLGAKLVREVKLPNGVYSWSLSPNISKELGSEEASYYQSQIGILRWMVEVGRVDIITEDCEWKNFYGDVQEAIPTNTPLARGKEVIG
eukprot:scaffold61252_cov61-Attheya_sp.AAC.3